MKSWGYDFSSNQELQKFEYDQRYPAINYPSIYGDIVVWVDHRNENLDIYGYDFSTNQEFKITTDPSNQQSPIIYGDIVVWEDWRSGNWDIFGYDLSTNQEFRITTNSASQYSPAIYMNTIVWVDYRNGNEDIYGYVPSTILPPPSSTPPGATPPSTTPPPFIPSLDPVLLGILGFAVAFIGILLAFFRIDIRKIREWLRKKGLQPSRALEEGQKEPALFKNDIAISFAGEDRDIARKLARMLQKKKIRGIKVRVFYDEFRKSELWGKKLTEYFRQVYGPESRFVVLLLSKYYPIKDWTDFEFSIIREEAERRETEFILLVRLDDTKMEGIPEDMAYLDYKKEGIDGILDCLLEKLCHYHSESFSSM